MYRQYIRRNITSVSIILFVVLFAIIQYLEPAFLYEKDGSLRKFGLGSSRKTVIPIWLVTFIISIFYYLFVLYYLSYTKMSY